GVPHVHACLWWGGGSALPAGRPPGGRRGHAAEPAFWGGRRTPPRLRLEHLAQVEGPQAGAPPRQPTPHLHEAARVARHEALRAVLSTLASFLSSTAVETSGRRTENDPPKPQHSSAPGSSTSSQPFTALSSALGLRDSPSPRSGWRKPG